MFCSNCGKEIDIDAKFCSKCGTKLDKKRLDINKNTNDKTEYENYLLDMFHIFNCLNNKPSIIYLNNTISIL